MCKDTRRCYTIYMKNNKDGLKILSGVGIFFILIGLYALSSNIRMKETIGEITYCSRVYDRHRDSNYWMASAKFFVDGNEYYGNVNVTSYKYVGQKIKILYNPKNPSDFISKSSTYSGFIMIIFGCVFLIPKFQNDYREK